MIPLSLMWLALVGGQTQPSTAGHVQMNYGYWEMVQEPVKPVEHVIEIRTKRTTRNVLLWRCPTTDNGFYCGHQFPPVVQCKPGELYRGDTRSDNTVTQQCVSVTKTLWIDGQRIGVIREVEEK